MCSGQGTILSASGANSYTWNTGSTSNGFVASPSTTTTYTVTGKVTSTGCINTQTATVTISTPTVVITGSTTICRGTVVNLVAGGANTYTWSTGTQSVSINVTPTVTTIYTVSAKDAFGCNGSDTHTITVFQTPTVSIAGNAVICSGGSVTFTATGAASYTWNTGSINTIETFTPSSSTVYTVTGVDVQGCTASFTRTVIVNALPAVAISGANAICAGSTTSLNVTGASTYTWNTFSNSNSISITPTGTTVYSVTGTAANSCTNSAVKTVTVNSLPVLNVSTTNTLLCVGETATISVSGASTYTWSDASNGTDIVVAPITGTNYSVTGVDANGCSNNATFTQSVSVCTGINEVNAPVNYFSVFPNPNNGTFTIQGQVPDLITITNELGQLIKTVKLNRDNNFSIDATHLESGIYFLSGKSARVKIIVTQ